MKGIGKYVRNSAVYGAISLMANYQFQFYRDCACTSCFNCWKIAPFSSIRLAVDFQREWNLYFTATSWPTKFHRKSANSFFINFRNFLNTYIDVDTVVKQAYHSFRVVISWNYVLHILFGWVCIIHKEQLIYSPLVSRMI